MENNLMLIDRTGLFPIRIMITVYLEDLEQIQDKT